MQMRASISAAGEAGKGGRHRGARQPDGEPAAPAATLSYRREPCPASSHPLTWVKGNWGEMGRFCVPIGAFGPAGAGRMLPTCRRAFAGP